MKRKMFTIIKVILAILLSLLPLSLCIIHIHKPIAPESYAEMRSALLGCYYFFSSFGGIYYSVLNLLLLWRKRNLAFFIGVCGLLLYHIANGFAYFLYDGVDNLGSAIIGFIASYHFMSFILCFGAAELIQYIISGIRKKAEEKVEVVSEGELEKKRQRKKLKKYIPGIYMLIWGISEYMASTTVNVVSGTEGIRIAILSFFLLPGYFLPIVHPLYLTLLSYNEKHFFKTLFEICISLLPYILFLFFPLSIEQNILWIVAIYEYVCVCFLWGLVYFLLRKRRDINCQHSD